MNISVLFTHTITHFPFNGVDKYGARTFGAKREIKARWEDTVTVVQDSNGRDINAQSRIFMDDDSVKAGDYLYNGTTSETSPTNLEDARAVVSVKKIKTLDDTFELKVAFL